MTLILTAPRRAAMPGPEVVWRAVHAAADRLTATLRAALFAAVTGLQDTIDLDALAVALLRRDTRAAEDLLGLASLEPVLEQAVVSVLVSGAQRGARAARPSVPVIGVRYDLVNESAVAWAERYAAAQVREVSDETRQAIRTAVAAGYRDGIGPSDLARQLRGTLGLNTRQAGALARLRATLVAAKRTPLAVETLTSAYARRLLRQRADTIARTELLTAANRGQQLLWEQAKQDGVLDARMEREWIVTQGANVCAQCLALGGERAPIGGHYPDGMQGPPLHPMCRCTEGLVLRGDQR